MVYEHIRLAENKDTARIAEIIVFGWRCAYRGIVTDEQLFGRMSVANRKERIEEQIRDQFGETYVYDDGIVKAMLTIGKCRNEDKPDAFELWGIYVEPLMKGQGIGTKLVRFCEGKAVERGYKEICLWVLEKNAASRGFYEKCGYKPDGKSFYIEGLDATEVRYTKELSF